MHRHVGEAEAQQEVSGKVTGMILEGQSIEQLLYLCGNKKAFYDIVKEAITLIKSQEEPSVPESQVTEIQVIKPEATEPKE